MVREGPADVRADGVFLTLRRHFVIFNPASGRGRGRRGIEEYRSLLDDALDDVTFAATTRPGEERDLAERAADEGFDVIVAVGGDGTWSNVADRLVASGRDEVVLGILPNGTGNDFGRNFGFDPRNRREAVRVLADGHVRAVDVGRVDTPSAPEHAPDRFEERHFLNVVGFGFDIAVLDAASHARFLSGELLYKVVALQQLFRFPGLSIGLGDEAERGRALMLTVSNARYFGGGFPIAPEARIDDGKLHACRIGDAGPLTRLSLFRAAERGRHVARREVEVIDDAAFRLHFDAPPRFEMDGELRRAGSATLEVRAIPGALRVVGPPA